MTIDEAKQINIADYLHSLGHDPVRQQGHNLWYKSPFRDERVPSFKVNTGRNLWYDFALGEGGNLIALAGKTLRFERRVLSLETYRRAGTASAPSVFLFWPAILLRRR